MRLLISGYGGSPEGNGGNTAGVYDTGLGRFVWESGIEGISFMCADEERDVIFGAGEAADGGRVYMFAKDNGGYALCGALDVKGGSLCHLAYSKKHEAVAGACYGNGDVFTAKVGRSGFGGFVSYVAGEGDSRAHCAVFSADENFLYSADIAKDIVNVFSVSGGELKYESCARLGDGAGPRHLILIGRDIYVITEYSNEVYRFTESGANAYEERQRTSILPDGFDGPSYGSSICFLPASGGEGFIYAANRGPDVIAALKRKADGSLEVAGHYGCAGKWPRHIEIVDINEKKYLAIANERSGFLSLHQIDEADGSFGEPELRVPFGRVSFVL